MSELYVEFAGEEHFVASSLTFGRAADLELDTTEYLHRIAGQFRRDGDHWWLINRGSRLFLRLTTSTGTRVDLAPASQQAIPAGKGQVSLRVGELLFEINYEAPAIVQADYGSPNQVSDTGTLPLEALLTPREVDFLVTFARPVLEGKVEQLPTYAAVAEVWDVSRKTLDNTLQTLRRKLRNARLIRDEALDELVHVAVAHSLVTGADLTWAQLDTDRPQRAAKGPRFNQE